jgi:hypothetical protein
MKLPLSTTPSCRVGDSLLLVVHQWLIFPRNFLIFVEQYPCMMAGAQAACIGANVAGRVALGEQVATRLGWTAVRRKANLLASLEVVNDTSCGSERLGTN